MLLWIGIAATTFMAFTVLVLALDTGEWRQALWTMTVTIIVQLLIIVPLYRATQLIVRIDTQGIFVRLRPFQFKGRLIPWTEISSVEIRKVRPIGEFGGWGIRWNLGNKTGYILNGEQGLDIRLSNGKVVVITIMDVEGARQVVNNHITSGGIR